MASLWSGVLFVSKTIETKMFPRQYGYKMPRVCKLNVCIFTMLNDKVLDKLSEMSYARQMAK